ncbi:MAG TPA: hypothetical protein VGM92_09040 [Candidatus Kapabacteria bacterium]|jgi:hypothetical protein
MADYKKRVVAFIDLLGFKSMVDRTLSSDGDVIATEVAKIAETISTFRTNVQSPIFEDTDDRPLLTHFSDSLVLSFNPEYEGEVLRHFSAIRSLITDLIQHHYVACRGAITYGWIHHSRDDRMGDVLFGPALIEAYNKERFQAKYPRIIIDNDVVELGIKHRADGTSENFARSSLREYLLKDDDQVWFIDYISKNIKSIWDNSLQFLPQYYDDIRITANRMITTIDEKVRAKGSWLISKVPSR